MCMYMCIYIHIYVYIYIIYIDYIYVYVYIYIDIIFPSDPREKPLIPRFFSSQRCPFSGSEASDGAGCGGGSLLAGGQFPATHRPHPSVRLCV